MTQRSEDFPPGEPWSLERQLEFDQQKRDAAAWAAGLANRDPRETERNLRGLSYEDKEALKRAGYKGNLSPITGENSGQLTRKIEARPSYFETYEGDPDTWMNQFKPPVKHQMLLIRQNENESTWQDRRARETNNFNKYGKRNPPPPPGKMDDQPPLPRPSPKPSSSAAATPLYTS